MRRRALLISLALGLLGAPIAQPTQAASLDSTTMKAALRTTTQEEEGFIDYVLGKMEEGTLPAAMLESTFQWARQKPKHKFQYFKRALLVRAAKAGIQL